MVYLDSDVLIHFLVEQDIEKHTQADQIFHQLTTEGSFFLSFVTLQEIAFVLGKLDIPVKEAELQIRSLLTFGPQSYGQREYERALQLARQIGFRHFNDCLHLAIAEVHCSEIITYNKSDFSRLRPLTGLKVSIF